MSKMTAEEIMKLNNYETGDGEYAMKKTCEMVITMANYISERVDHPIVFVRKE